MGPISLLGGISLSAGTTLMSIAAGLVAIACVLIGAALAHREQPSSDVASVAVAFLVGAAALAADGLLAYAYPPPAVPANISAIECAITLICFGGVAFFMHRASRQRQLLAAIMSST